MGIITTILYFVYAFICVLLILIVLVQRGSGEDLGGAFGGAGGGEQLLGAHGDMTLKKITAVFALLFFVLAIVIGAIELSPDTTSASKTKGDTKKSGEENPGSDSQPEEQ